MQGHDGLFARQLLKAQYDFVTNVFTLNRWAGKPSADSVESVNARLSPCSSSQKLAPPPDPFLSDNADGQPGVESDVQTKGLPGHSNG
jgi:hypothetical protein